MKKLVIIIKYSNSAFTLIEIIAVILMISVFSFILIPKFNIAFDYSLKASIEKIAIDLRWARTKAIIDNKKYYFRIYKDDDIYKIDSDDKSDYIIFSKEENGEINILKEGNYPSKYTLYKNKSVDLVEDDYFERINFTPYGTSRLGTIVLKSNTGKLFKVIVNSQGRVIIEK
ncbi:MAG: pilus assembly FimT family protein [Bacillota bacterium]